MEICPYSKQPCDKPKDINLDIEIDGEHSSCKCCDQCIDQLISPVTLLMEPSIITSLFSNKNALSENLKNLELMEKNFVPTVNCTGCGLSLQEIKSKGRFGCKECYTTHKEQINGLLPHIQAGAKNHIGKKPKNCISSFKEEMQKAIKEERYEDAAKLRDVIKKLE